MSSQKLSVGDFGPAVTQLHARLEALGFTVDAEEKKRQFFGPATRAIVQTYQQQQGLNVTGELDEATAAAIAPPALTPPQPEPLSSPISPDLRQPELPTPPGMEDSDRDRYLVTGRIRTTEGLPVSGLTIQAFDKKVLREPTPLGNATTNEEGTYHLDYTDKVTELGLADSVDLLVQCRDSSGTLLQQSPLMVNAPRHASVDFTVAKSLRPSPALFGVRDRQFRQLLGDGEPAALKEDDFAYLTAKLNLDRPEIHRLIHARTLAQAATSLNREVTLPPAIFYALASGETPPDLPAIVNQPRATLTQTLQQAIADNLIQLEPGQTLETVVSSLKELAIALAWTTPENPDTYTLRNLVDCTGLEETTRRQFVQAYTLNEKPLPEFWKDLSDSNQNPDLSRHATTFQKLFDLAALTDNSIPLIRALSRHQVEVRQFASFDPPTWNQYFRRYRLPLAEAEAAKLTQRLQKQYPTVHLIASLKRDRVLTSAEKPSRDLQDFCDRHPDFVFGQRSVNRYLNQETIQQEFADELSRIESEEQRAIRQHQQDDLKRELRHLELAYLLAPQTDKTTCVAALRALNLAQHQPALPAPSEPKQFLLPAASTSRESNELVVSENQISENQPALSIQPIKADSAIKIATTNPATFFSAWKKVRQGQGMADQGRVRQEAEEIYKRARYLAFLTTFHAWNSASALDRVLPAFCVPAQTWNAQLLSSQLEAAETSLSIANLQTLFGQSGYCECIHCQSIYGPARYLVELYATLPDSLKPQLILRRPDIWTLYLNCENTHTQLPYIDLVNELLELRVASSYGLVNPSNDPSNGLQTTHRQEELALRPEHEEPYAYVCLSLLPYPISLPWDKWFEEARRYLNYLGVPLHHLVAVFMSQSQQIRSAEFDLWQHRQAQWCNDQVVRAHLGLTVPLYDLIAKPITLTTDTQFGSYLLPDGSALFNHYTLDKLSSLGTFMKSLGLWRGDAQGDTGAKDFELVREILGCRYINPNDHIQLDYDQDKGDPCDIARYTLPNLTSDFLVTLTKFEHLRRILGWRPRELNQAILVFERFQPQDKRGTLDETVLQRISHLVRLQQKRAKISVMELLSWWGPIETGAGWQPVSPFYEGERKREENCSLYERVFLNKSLYGTKPEEQDKKSAWPYFELNDLGNELRYLSGNADPMQVTEFNAILSAALGLREKDLAELLSFVQETYGDRPLTLKLETLSRLYRVVSLSRYLKLSMREFVLVHGLLKSQPEPFLRRDNSPFSSTSNTLRFVEAVEQIQRSPFKIADLAYLWHHQLESLRELENINQRIKDYLPRLQQALRDAQTQALSVSPTGEIIQLITQVNTLIEGLPQRKQALVGWLRNAFSPPEFPPNPRPIQNLPFLPADQQKDLAQLVGLYRTTLNQMAANSPEAANKIREMVAFLETLDQLQDIIAVIKWLQEVLCQGAQLGTEIELGRRFAFLLPGQVRHLYQLVSNLPTRIRSFIQSGQLPAIVERAIRLLETLASQQEQAATVWLTWLQDMLSQGTLPGTEADLAQRLLLVTPAEVSTLYQLQQGVSKPSSTTQGVDSASQIAELLTTLGYSEETIDQLKLRFSGRDSLGTEAELAQQLPCLPGNQVQILYQLAQRFPGSAGLKRAAIAVLQPPAAIAAALVQDLASFFNLDVDQAKALATLGLGTALGQQHWLVQALLTWITNQSAVSNDTLKQLLLQFDKSAALVRGWQLCAAEIRYIGEFPAAFQGFTFYSLPISSDAAPKPTFQQWSSLATYAELRQQIALKDDDLVGLFRRVQQAQSSSPAATPPPSNLPAAPAPDSLGNMPSLGDQLLGDLATLLRVDAGELQKIAEIIGLYDSTTHQLIHSALTNGDTLRRIVDVVDVMKRSGCRVDRLQGWVCKPGRSPKDLTLDASFMEPFIQYILNPVASPVQSSDLLHYKDSVVEQIRNAVRANVGDSSWQEVARKQQDKMRILQRDKLLDAFLPILSYILPDHSWPPLFRNVEDVYDFLLIDPLVNPCMQTTRLKQAISSVQLLIHRALMGLEDKFILKFILETLGLKDEDPGAQEQIEIIRQSLAQEWQWKKRYRLWEAQQKVLLYPENWIEPELRDDKTPFFKEFETELSQSELNEKVIEQAYKNYLSKVDEVGHLEVAAFTESEGELHIIGRTRETPRVHYYRKRSAKGIWLPWERVELDIDSEVVLMIVHQGILCVFWPTIKERVQKLGQDNPNDENNDKNNYRPLLEIRFNWSRYEDGRWSPRKRTNKHVQLLYDWRYKELYPNVESLIEYDIETVETTGEIVISLNIITNVTERLEKYSENSYWASPLGWFEIKKRCTWDEQKLESKFKAVYDLIGNIDWFYIHGSNFRLWGSDIKETLRGPLENAKLLAVTALCNGDPALAIDGDPERGIDGIINKLGSSWMQVGPYPLPSHGIISKTLLLWTDQFHNQSYSWEHPSVGLRQDDRDAIWKLTFDDWKITPNSIDVRTFEHCILRIDRRGILAYAVWETPFDYQARNERCTFGKITFSGYQLDEKPYNFTGLKSQSPLGWGEFASLAGDPPIPFPYFVHQKTAGVPVPHSTHHWSHVPIPVLGSSNSEVIPENNLYVIDNSKCTDKELNQDGVSFSILLGDEWLYPLPLFKLHQRRVYLTLSKPVNVQLSHCFFHDNQFCQELKWNKDEQHYLCRPFYHAYIKDYNNTIHNHSYVSSWDRFDRLLNLEVQTATAPFPYRTTQNSYIRIERIREDSKVELVPPSDNAVNKIPYHTVEFGFTQPFGLYNWEIFFHMPFTLAVRLSQNKQFEQAQRWFHYIFNPLKSVNVEGGNYTNEADRKAASYWNFWPLHQLGMPPKVDEKEIEARAIEVAKDPFNPHRIARERMGAYQKAVVIKYLDNLIAWGDHLFQQDTLETINEATHLYILAAKILGPRPKVMPKSQSLTATQPSTPALSEGELSPEGTELGELTPVGIEAVATDQSPLPDPCDPTLGKLTSYSEQLVDLDQMTWVDEQHLSAASLQGISSGIAQYISVQVFLTAYFTSNQSGSDPQTLQSPQPAFCIPHNDHLLSYWDTVADRLFKIRNCRNIAGQVRELPIFEPPIDPALLVRGVALNVDISELLSDLYTPLPPYRFRVMLQKALEFCGDVQRLGSALLSALEKRDAEALSLLRSQHERQMLKLNESIRKQQIEELKETLKATHTSLAMAEGRFEYYSSREFENSNEKTEVVLLNVANAFNISSQAINLAASAAYIAPNFHLSAFGNLTTETGGKQWGDTLSAMGKFLGMISTQLSHEAHMQSIQGAHHRRMDDWQFQAQQASKEMEQLQKQILASEIRIAIAEQELENLRQQQDHAEEVETFLKSKFTNQELYHWMASQTSTLYFQSYKLALELARKAQKCYRMEQCDDTATFIGATYWDNLKKGLLSGETLQLDLRRMEAAYLQRNERELELTKHISLALLNPLELIKLRETGECTVNIPEVLFDLDHPGHYMRRIKSVSLTLPCVAGPYTSVSATLTLQTSHIRKTTSLASNGQNQQYAWEGSVEDSRFNYDIRGIQSIATSTAQNDSGLFELNFNDDRYLPFEGAGAISTWRLELPAEFRQFDYDTISDVILHLRYTAQDGGTELKNPANDEVARLFADASAEVPLIRAFSAKQEFGSEWHQFLHPKATDASHRLDLAITPNRFPFQFCNKAITISKVEVFLQFKDIQNDTYTTKTPLGDYIAGTKKLGLYLVLPGDNNSQGPQMLTNDPLFQGTPHTSFDALSHPVKATESWTLEAGDDEVGAIASTLRTSADGHKRLKAETIDDLIVVCHYSVQ